MSEQLQLLNDGPRGKPDKRTPEQKRTRAWWLVHVSVACGVDEFTTRQILDAFASTPRQKSISEKVVDQVGPCEFDLQYVQETEGYDKDGHRRSAGYVDASFGDHWDSAIKRVGLERANTVHTNVVSVQLLRMEVKDS